MSRSISSILDEKVSALHQPIIKVLEKVRTEDIDILHWLATMRAILLPKKNNTHEPKNYRPIGFQNTLYKVFTSILAYFIQDHCITNNIIAPEQGRGKPGS